MSRKKKLLFAVAAVIVCVSAASWIVWCSARTEVGEPVNAAAPASAPAQLVRENSSNSSSRPSTAGAPGEAPKMGTDEELYAMFSADATGRLVLNPATRLNIEKLHALNSPEDVLVKAGRLSKVLPPVAHSELLKLTASYVQYIDALQEAFPPEAEVETVGEAEAELKGIHKLRIKHFGPEVTEALFGEEERLSRRLVALMALEADEKIPLAEKAHRAQLLLQSDSQTQPADPRAP